MTFGSFLKLIRIPNLLIIAITQYIVRWCLIYPILKTQNSYYTVQLSEIQFFLLVLSTVMIAAAGYIINDYFDVRIDKINKPERLLIDKMVKRRVAMGAHMVINILAVLIGCYVSYSIGITKLAVIHLMCVTGLWFYSTTFKRQFLIGNIMVAIFTALVPAVVAIYESLPCYREYIPIDETFSFKAVWVYTAGLSFFTFIAALLREIIKDMEHYEGDKEYGYKTMPVVIGQKSSKVVAIIIAGAMIVFLFYFQLHQLRIDDTLTLYYFLFALQIPLIFLIYKIIKAETKEAFALIGNITKFIMLMGICYLFIFAYVILHFIHQL
jgi:4-hydroxybenzoate polyprenyltransferase